MLESGWQVPGGSSVYVVGTAGHVDHGKSTLVQALTGIDPDRLQEEKTRGMTIDLGFAWLKLPSGREVSLVDVPGHERFIKNMLAGVGGIDLALLVVAADEGVMPQTREHLAIIDLLKIATGVVAITKTDLVDADWLDLVVADVEEVLHGTTLESSPIVACSAISRAGLPELLATLDRQLDVTPAKRDIGRPRLSIDRSFTISGFGTVVTGTLVEGNLRVGEEIELLPEGRRARVRGLQTHRQKVERATPGSRTAVNLAGVPANELRRGMLLTTPGWLEPTTAADVRLNAVSDLARPIKHNISVTLHAGAAEVAAKVRLLDRNELEPGQAGWAQVRLAEPLPLLKGDSFVIRTPNATIGGGTVVDSHPRRHRRNHEPTLASLEILERGSPEEALLNVLAKLEPVALDSLARETDFGAQATREIVEAVIRSGRAVKLGESDSNPTLFTAEGYRHILDNALRALQSFFAEHPLRSGMSREELKSRLGLRPKVFSDLLARWLAENEIVESTASVSLPGRQVLLNQAQQRGAAEFLETLRAAPFAPPNDHLPPPELLAFLIECGDVVQVAEGIVFGADAYHLMLQRITEHLQSNGTVTLAQVRDLFGTTRKYAQALLEHLDEERITRRIGDERVLRSAEAARR